MSRSPTYQWICLRRLQPHHRQVSTSIRHQRPDSAEVDKTVANETTTSKPTPTPTPTTPPSSPSLSLEDHIDLPSPPTAEIQAFLRRANDRSLRKVIFSLSSLTDSTTQLSTALSQILSSTTITPHPDTKIPRYTPHHPSPGLPKSLKSLKSSTDRLHANLNDLLRTPFPNPPLTSHYRTDFAAYSPSEQEEIRKNQASDLIAQKGRLRIALAKLRAQGDRTAGQTPSMATGMGEWERERLKWEKIREVRTKNHEA